MTDGSEMDLRGVAEDDLSLLRDLMAAAVEARQEPDRFGPYCSDLMVCVTGLTPEKSLEVIDRCKAAEAQIAALTAERDRLAGLLLRWGNLGEAIQVNDPADMVADGVTCHDAWIKEIVALQNARFPEAVDDK